jgi:phage gpG-like protein
MPALALDCREALPLSLCEKLDDRAELVGVNGERYGHVHTYGGWPTKIKADYRTFVRTEQRGVFVEVAE